MIRKLLDGFFYLRKGLVTSVAYASLWVYGSEVRWRDLWDQAFPALDAITYDLSKAQALDQILEAAKEALEAADARRAGITEKCKTLLTVSSLLIGVVGILLPKGLAFGPWWIQVAFFVAALSLFNAVILLLEFFNVRAAMVVAYDQSDLELLPDEFTRTTIKAYFTCRADIDRRTDYLAEIYKAARFSFLAAFTFVVLLFSTTFFWSPIDKEGEVVARRLHTDSSFVAAVRGEKGAVGPQGAKGDPGIKGDPGVRGDRGENAIIDEDRMVERILQHPQFRQLPSPRRN